MFATMHASVKHCGARHQVLVALKHWFQARDDARCQASLPAIRNVTVRPNLGDCCSRDCLAQAPQRLSDIGHRMLKSSEPLNVVGAQSDCFQAPGRELGLGFQAEKFPRLHS